MFEFAMAHEVICLIIILSLIWACERAFTAFATRNKPSCDCACCDDKDEDTTEVVAMGGEEENER
jgi:hypothetical protein